MAANSYLDSVAGEIQQKLAAQSSAGAGDAGKIIALDSGGKLPVSMLPNGVGQLVFNCASFENLGARAMVNFYNNAGVINARNADATGPLACHGFVIASVTAPAAIDVYVDVGLITGFTALTVGARYYLSTVGGITATPPSASGNIVQYLGIALSATELFFNPKDYVKLA